MKKLLCVFFCVMLAALSAVVFTGGKDTQKNYIKYVEFNVTKDALQNAVDLDIQTHDDLRISVRNTAVILQSTNMAI